MMMRWLSQSVVAFGPSLPFPCNSPLSATPPRPHTSLLFCRYTGATLLSQQANTSASEHRDALVHKLMAATGLTADMPVPPYLRRDLPLFFETFEAFKVGKAAGSGNTTVPPAAAAETAKAATTSPAEAAKAVAASFSPEAAPTIIGAEVIKVNSYTINICSLAFPQGFSGIDDICPPALQSMTEIHGIQANVGIDNRPIGQNNESESDIYSMLVCPNPPGYNSGKHLSQTKFTRSDSRY
jgi:hypothetical protein